MLREGEGDAADVPQAASMTHVRALNFLPHALFGPESLVAHYAREQALKKHKERGATSKVSKSPNEGAAADMATTNAINATNATNSNSSAVRT